MALVKSALVTRDKARIIEDLQATHLGQDPYLLDNTFDKYIAYSANFSDRRNAKTLLEVRTNCMFKPAEKTAMGLECPVCHNKFTTVGNLTFPFSCCNKTPIFNKNQVLDQLLMPKGEELVSFLEQCRELKSKYWTMYICKFHPEKPADRAVKKTKKKQIREVFDAIGDGLNSDPCGKSKALS
jgi:hypothetical protein